MPRPRLLKGKEEAMVCKFLKEQIIRLVSVQMNDTKDGTNILLTSHHQLWRISNAFVAPCGASS